MNLWSLFEHWERSLLMVRTYDTLYGTEHHQCIVGKPEVTMA